MSENPNDLFTDNDFSAMLDAFDSEHSAIERGDIIDDVEILEINPNEILVALPNSKHDGIVPYRDIERMPSGELSALKPGDLVAAYVLNPLDNDGNVIVSLNLGKQGEDWRRADDLLKSGEVIDVEITGSNPGGVLVKFGRIEGFIPNSHFFEIAQGLRGQMREQAIRNLRGQMVGVKVIEINQARRRLVLSQREAQREWREARKKTLLETLTIGDIISGTVTGVRDFGIFVDLGGADGLIHVSEVAWYRVPHPEDVVAIGDELEVYVLDLDHEKQRIALSRKRTLPDPWKNVIDNHQVGETVTGRVLNVVDYGAFIVLEDGIEGLLHVTEMADGTLTEPYSYVSRGDTVTFKIVSIDVEEKHITFTQKEDDLRIVEDEPMRHAALKKPDVEEAIPLPEDDADPS